VAASHSYLQYVGAGSKNPNLRQPMDTPEGIRLILGFDRILLMFTCPSHAWNWPRPIQGNKPDGFDAHQTCFKCSTERLYNTNTLQAGPLYRTLVPGTVERPQRGPAKSLKNWKLFEVGGRGLLKIARLRRG
jgi:hypothetical protein